MGVRRRPEAESGGAPGVRARTSESQRWEAVFRRERRPASLDRRAGAVYLPPDPRKGKLPFLFAIFLKEFYR